MYLVTYLGRLCNGLTVLIIGKTEKTRSEWLLYQKVNVCFCCRCDRCVFPPAFLQTPSGNDLLQLLCAVNLDDSCVNLPVFFFVNSQEKMDGFIAKIQAHVDNIKDM